MATEEPLDESNNPLCLVDTELLIAFRMLGIELYGELAKSIREVVAPEGETKLPCFQLWSRFIATYTALTDAGSVRNRPLYYKQEVGENADGSREVVYTLSTELYNPERVLSFKGSYTNTRLNDNTPPDIYHISDLHPCEDSQLSIGATQISVKEVISPGDGQKGIIL